MRRIRSVFVISSFVFLVLCISLSLIISNMCKKKTDITYQREIVLINNVCFDDDSTILNYGEPVVIPAGTKGLIIDKIDYWGDELGTDLIRVDFKLSDGSVFWGAISFSGTHEEKSSRSIIDINDISDSENVLSEYLDSREAYYSHINRIPIVCLALGVCISIVTIIVFSIVYLSLIRKGLSTTYLIKLILGLDIFLIMINLIGVYMFVIR